MGRNKALWFLSFIAAGALQIAHNPARAADILPPAPPLEEPSLSGGLAEESGVYFRLDAGFANASATRSRSIYGELGAVEGSASIGEPFLFGLGAGYQFNPWLRADLTGEYRPGVPYHASSTAQFVGDAVCPTGGTVSCGDEIHATVKTELFLANGYVDIGNWSGVTPYVGAGVGLAAWQVSAMKEQTLYPAGALGFAPNASGANFAWSLTAGLAYQLSPNLLIDLNQGTYLGTSMLGAIVKLWKRVALQGGRLALCNVSEPVLRVLRVTKLQTIWPIYGSRTDALTALAG